MTTRFLLLRHARTSWNAQKRIQGQTDIPLSAEGRAMAAAWAAALRSAAFDALLTSDLSRAVETATLVAVGRGLEPRIDARLREQDWGRWVGLTTTEVIASPEYAAQSLRGWDFRPPDGEDRRQVLARALESLTLAAAAGPGRTWLVVTHQGVLKALAHHLAGSDFRLPTDGTGEHPIYDKAYRLRVVEYEDGAFRLAGDGEDLPA